MAFALDVLSHAWNAFRKSPTTFVPSIAYTRSYNPNHRFLTRGNDRSIVAALYNRVAIDVAAIEIRHCKVDPESKQYLKTINSGLNTCLNFRANINQTGRDLIMDAVLTMFDDGVAALVPVDTNIDISNGSFEIETMRVGRVVEWYPRAVKLSVYNDAPDAGKREEVIFPLDKVAIIQNPLYQVMNEPNSTAQRLLRKLNQLDSVDENAASNKLNMILQLPYTIKTDEKKRQAQARLKDLEDQLTNSAYGVGYIDAADKVTQLSRPIENHLLDQVKDLRQQLYGQLGVSEAIVNGTANELEMLNYYNRTLEPILAAICDSVKSTFLTKTARTQGQDIKFFRDPFRLVPLKDLANIFAAFTSNEIISSNEARGFIGLVRSDETQADQLRNANINPLGTDVTNMNKPETSIEAPISKQSEDGQMTVQDVQAIQSDMDDLDSQMNELLSSLEQ